MQLWTPVDARAPSAGQALAELRAELAPEAPSVAPLLEPGGRCGVEDCAAVAGPSGFCDACLYTYPEIVARLAANDRDGVVASEPAANPEETDNAPTSPGPPAEPEHIAAPEEQASARPAEPPALGSDSEGAPRPDVAPMPSPKPPTTNERRSAVAFEVRSGGRPLMRFTVALELGDQVEVVEVPL